MDYLTDLWGTGPDPQYKELYFLSEMADLS